MKRTATAIHIPRNSGDYVKIMRKFCGKPIYEIIAKTSSIYEEGNPKYEPLTKKEEDFIFAHIQHISIIAILEKSKKVFGCPILITL